MNIKAVLFDLDGTLLPMDADTFAEAYFKGLCKKLSIIGYDSKLLVDSIWRGTAAMVKNDGSLTNEQAFWTVLEQIYGESIRNHIPYFDDYYKNEFLSVKEVCGFNPKAKQTIDLIKSKGLRLALATNPIFPKIATEARIRWAGLEPEDFEFYTTYETARHCKPNPDYYKDILNELGLEPEECLMVGNDALEDMIAETIGMKVFLLTDCFINKKGGDISRYAAGNFDALIKFMNENV